MLAVRVDQCRTYRHQQFEGCKPISQTTRFGAPLDDSYSPIQPQKYIQIRILPMMQFYKRGTR